MGKLIGGLIGFMMFNIPGIIIGLWLGHLYDKSVNARGFDNPFNGQPHPDTQRLFFESLFRLLGYMAKADGRVSEAEIKQAEALMQQSGLSPDARRQAIQLFQEGATARFNIDAQLDDFLTACGRNARLKQTLVVYLIGMALADGQLDKSERQVLEKVASYLGIPAMMLNQLINMVGAQAHFRSGDYHQSSQHHQDAGYRQQSSQDELNFAYQALGISSSSSDAEIKKAYRKLMSENHPDKLAGQGVPQEMIEMATQRSQEISKAYDLIKSSRK